MSHGALADRVVLVTGAGGGLGRAVAVACARQGARLVLTARRRVVLEELDDLVRAAGAEPATLITLDLLKDQLVDALGGALYERFRRLDGFVHCAGDLGILTPTAQLDPTLFARVMQINALSAQRLLRTLHPLFKLSGSGRIVFVTDRVASTMPPYWTAYAASKRALEAIGTAYAAEARIVGAGLALALPPPLPTRLRAKAFPGEDQATLARPDEVATKLVALLDPAVTATGTVVPLAD